MKKTQSGFTLIELITVMLLVGILSAAAFSRFPDNRLYQQSLAAKKIQTYLRLTQQTAMAQTQKQARKPTLSTASLSLQKTSVDHWQVVIDNGHGFEQYTFILNTDILVNSQPIDNSTLTLHFSADGDFIEQSFIRRSKVTHSLALQIGDELVCVAPTGYSYAGACI
jgi:MSHA pilin protein MshC